MSDRDTFSETVEYQIKILAMMVSCHQFCSVASTVLQAEDFSNKTLQWYFTTLSDSSPKLTLVTLQEELFSAVRQKQVKEDQISSYVDLFEHLKTAPVSVEEEHIRDRMSTFMRTQAVKRAILNSFDLIKQNEWSKISEIVTEATTKGVELLSIGQNYFTDYQDRLSRRLNQEAVRKIPTGVPGLDDMLYGGIKNKQLGLIVGGTGRGKSIFLEWLGRVAILLNRNVVYITLELSEDDVAERYDSLFARVRPQELITYNRQVFKALSPLSERFGSRLMIKEYPADEASVPVIKAYLQQLSSVGVMPDMVIIDYLDLIRPHRKYSDHHQELDSITKSLHGLAKQLNTRIWTATQLNRAGLVMETPDESTIAGAVAKLFTVDISIFMAQTKEEREDEIMRLFLCKNRNGPAGRTITIDTDYSFMTFYRPPTGDHEPGRLEETDSATGQVSGSAEGSGDVLVL
tara:strand:- start:4 stop:1383 length:1380 start_codon:yes stop_codon:yes gene_type:complete